MHILDILWAATVANVDLLDLVDVASSQLTSSLDLEPINMSSTNFYNLGVSFKKKMREKTNKREKEVKALMNS